MSARGGGIFFQCAVLCVANVVIDARDSRRAFSLVSQVFALVVAARESLSLSTRNTEHGALLSTETTDSGPCPRRVRSPLRSGPSQVRSGQSGQVGSGQECWLACFCLLLLLLLLLLCGLSGGRRPLPLLLPVFLSSTLDPRIQTFDYSPVVTPAALPPSLPHRPADRGTTAAISSHRLVSPTLSYPGLSGASPASPSHRESSTVTGPLSTHQSGARRKIKTTTSYPWRVPGRRSASPPSRYIAVMRWHSRKSLALCSRVQMTIFTFASGQYLSSASWQGQGPRKAPPPVF